MYSKEFQPPAVEYDLHGSELVGDSEIADDDFSGRSQGITGPMSICASNNIILSSLPFVSTNHKTIDL